MITVEEIAAISKGDVQDAAKKLNSDDIHMLVDMLSLKDDNIRYGAFLLLQNRSMLNSDVYPFWDTFQGKLKSDNSYQRSIGLMLIAENVRWDTQHKTEAIIYDYLSLLNDEKPITVRQCIQSLGKVAQSKPALNAKIADRLISFDLMAVKETMRKSILLDIINVLLKIRKSYNSDEVESFISDALSGEILDKKSKKLIEKELLGGM
jgi:hypothetical protein